MKILLLSQFFSTTRGGGEHVFSLIAKNLAENGHEVWVITNKISGEDYKNHENIKLIFVKPDLQYKGGLPPSFLDNLRYSLNSIRIGLKIIKHERIDIIHSNNFSPALVGSILSFLTSKPHITSVWDIFSLCGQDYWDQWSEQAGVSKIYSLLGPFFEKIILKLSHNAIHTISESSKDDLIKFGAKKPIHVIHPAIETIKKIQTEFDPLTFVYVGRLVFYKNLEVVIRALNIVKEKYPKVKLVIIGGGPHKRSLEELIKKLGMEQNIEFSGYVSFDEKMRLVASSSALLFPSLCEGFGLVILEAFSQSKPVFVSNLRPMSDIIQHNKTGYLIDPHDPSAWSTHILETIQDTKKTEDMGKTASKELEKYSRESMYLKILEMYKKYT